MVKLSSLEKLSFFSTDIIAFHKPICFKELLIVSYNFFIYKRMFNVSYTVYDCNEHTSHWAKEKEWVHWVLTVDGKIITLQRSLLKACWPQMDWRAWYLMNEKSHYYSYTAQPCHTTYSWNIKWQKCARMGLNGFHIRKVFGTQDNWKNENPGSPFGATS